MEALNIIKDEHRNLWRIAITLEQVIAEMTAEQIWRDPIVTEVTAAPEFYTAEDYHQDYFANNPYQPYCMGVVAPKVAKARQKFMAKLKR